jgi:hypothetical protein
MHLPLFNIPFPGLTMLVFEQVVPIVKFDILDSIDWKKLIFGYESSEEEQLTIPD